VLTDHISALVAVPHRGGSRKSASRGYRRGVHDIGDVICDGTLPLPLSARKRLTFGAERSFAAANVPRVEGAEVFVFFKGTGRPHRGATDRFRSDASGLSNGISIAPAS
jgi:hypothetical protein